MSKVWDFKEKEFKVRSGERLEKSVFPIGRMPEIKDWVRSCGCFSVKLREDRLLLLFSRKRLSSGEKKKVKNLKLRLYYKDNSTELLEFKLIISGDV